ncbi:hypothetical protein MPSEU_000237800 [Mayamaea pseudoterrestris]|nr:hypothetical protein MPSEU_000237800 [Mayamaea pseudoterrestris]
MLVTDHEVSIPLVPRIKWETLSKQDLTFVKQDGTKVKRKIQIANDEDPVVAIRVIDEVTEVLTQMAFDGPEDHQFQTRKETVRLCLSGTIRDLWDQSVTDDDTLEGWNESVKAFLSNFMDPDEDLRKQKEYLKSIRLPQGMTVLHDDLKSLVLEMVPHWLQIEFRKQSLTNRLSDLTLHQLARWFDSMAALKEHGRKAVEKQEGGGQRQPRSGKGRKRGGGGNHKNGTQAVGTKKGNICQYHGGHTWDKCFGNPKSSNYKGPSFKLPDKKKIKTDKKSNETHVTETRDDDDEEDTHVIVDNAVKPNAKAKAANKKANKKSPSKAKAQAKEEEPTTPPSLDPNWKHFWDQVIGAAEE